MIKKGGNNRFKEPNNIYKHGDGEQEHHVCNYHAIIDTVLTMIQHTLKEANAWKFLQDECKMSTETKIQYLENQLTSEWMLEGEKLKVFITRIK